MDGNRDVPRPDLATWLSGLSGLALQCAPEAEMAQAAVAAVAAALGADMAHYCELSPAGTGFVLQATTGWHEGAVDRAGTVGAQCASFCRFVLDEARPVTVADFSDTGRFGSSGDTAELCAVSGLGTVVHAANGEALGALAAMWRSPRQFTVHEGDVLQTIANVLSVGILRRRSESRFKAVVQNSSDFVAVVDARGRFVYCNPALARLFGLDENDVRGVSTERFVHPEDLAATAEAFRRDASRPGCGPPAVSRFRTASGEWRHLEVVATNCLDDPAVRGIVLNGRDVTETTRLTRVLRTLSAGNHALVNANDEASLLADVCRAIVEMGGFPLAWVGYAIDDAGCSVRPVASAGRVAYLEGLEISWADRPEGRGPVGTVVREGGARVIADLTADRPFAIWRNTALRHGLRSACSLALPLEGKVIGALTIYAGEPGAFGPEEVSLLEELTKDLSYGIGRLRDALSLKASEQRFRDLAASAPIGIMETAASGAAEYVNARMTEITGYSATELVDRHWLDRVHPDDHASVLAIGETLRAGKVAVEQFRLVLESGPSRYVRVSVAAKGGDADNGYVVTVEDVDDEVLARQALAHQAFHDQLTGLANRAGFLEHLQSALAHNRRSGGAVAVLMLDLDRFKVVNDSLGHAAGDEVLVQLASRFSQAVREGDVVARFSGDEFMFILRGGRRPTDATRMAKRLLALLETPVRAGGHELRVTASVGIVLTRRHADATAVLRDADTAMYRAKAAGRNGWSVFDDTLHEESLRRLALEADLHRAVDGHELELHFQPLVEPVSGRPLSAEALVRWRSPERGLVGPAEFIPLAEETGLIVPIGRWVLEEAIAQLARWDRDAGGPQLDELAVNLSARQLDDPATPAIIERLLARHGLAPRRLCAEVTESALMSESTSTRRSLEAFRRLGVRVAIDDFGTGYSSLAYLHAMPVTTVKVDRSFIERLGTHEDSLPVVKAIIEMGHAMGLSVVAEGVSSGRLQAIVAGLGCESAQGFHWARPLPAEELTAWWDQAMAASAAPCAAAGRPHTGVRGS